ncbi:hypothetical protein MNV49_002911 [Pseudohyphozyma bogoriensis]|nr:hypothetical protein MNV49_002911 [Pseudohyphozyma bogoriensis]
MARARPSTPPLQPLALHSSVLPATPPPNASTSTSSGSASTNLALSQSPLALLDEDPSPPPTPTPSSSSHPSTNPLVLLSSAARIRAISPPTPAPSPQPHSTSRFPPPPSLAPGWADPSSGAAEEDDEQVLVATIRQQFAGMSMQARQRLLQSLIADSPPSSLSPLLPIITPRLKRDFLRTLPLELSFHVLSFVEDVRTLARASAVSRFWRALLEDEGTWKRMCWKSGFGSTEESHFMSHGQRLRNLEFGEREVEEGTPAGRERRGTLNREELSEFAARAENFGLRTGRDRDRELALSPTPNETMAWMEPVPQYPNFQPAVADMDVDGSDWNPTTTALLSPRRNRPLSLSHVSADPLASTSSAPHLLSSSLPSSANPSPSLPSSFFSSTSSPHREAASTPSKKPFSYKTHFKRAYLTESAWLRGPGRLLSTQMSADDGVVTSLGFDSEWIVVGMATSKVHVFEAGTGSYVKTLDGHELGVWCLTLVSKGGGRREEDTIKRKDSNAWEPAPTSPPTTSSSVPPSTPRRPARNATVHSDQPARRTGDNRTRFTNDSPTNSTFFRHPRASDDAPTSPEAHRPRRRSFHSFERRDKEGIRTGGMGLGAGGETGDSSQQAGVCGTARGWGQRGAIVVSGGCDRDVRVWDVETGQCLWVLQGHTSTVRCMRVLDGRPIAVSGSRDATLRVWNIQTGQPIHLLSGHEHSVRCIEVSGNKVVSGSYDATCRLWDVDTGECLFIFRGHIHQIYAVAFDGIRVVTGSLDSTVRIWSATTGEHLALLQGHTSLVGQLQLDPVSSVLITGGSDGRCIAYDLTAFQPIHRLCAHDNSVTCLQFDDRFIVTGGNDGRIKLWDFKTGAYIRELAEPCDAVWRVTFRDDKYLVF